ncbi:MAG: hypothetical protein ACLR6J_12635 [Parabacteroides merdae]
MESAYGLSLINCWNSSSGIPLWVLHNYPKVGWSDGAFAGYAL